MKRLCTSYQDNLSYIRCALRVSDSFDIIERELTVGKRKITFFYIDGFVKDGVMQRIMQHFVSRQSLGTAKEELGALPYVEAECISETESLLRAVLSGQAVLLAETFFSEAVVIDARTYPVRGVGEPDGDRVMQGSHDGFVETLVTNTALIRRRIRDPRLTMEHFCIGSISSTDVVMCYMRGVAKEEEIENIRKRLTQIKPKSLTLGFQSLSESLIRRGWLNPFPKIRTTERPDTASAQLIEGSILIICDTSPQVMVLPTSIFHYLEEANDYYFPPITGTYLRVVRTFILILSALATPLWYLYLQYADALPQALRFLIPDTVGALPIIVQLLLAELAIDGLKIASMNTPDMLSNSLSVVGALILGDFAVEVGWLCADVILYMAFVAIANFAQQNYELGYALKFMRIITLVLVYFFKIWGFVLGIAIILISILTNTTVSKKGYLYPLIPFNFRALTHLFIRRKKDDFENAEKEGKS